MSTKRAPGVFNGSDRVHKATEIGAEPMKRVMPPGLVGVAQTALEVLDRCHGATEILRDGLLPQEPATTSQSDEPLPPSTDLTTLLEAILVSSRLLHEKLGGLAGAVKG